MFKDEKINELRRTLHDMIKHGPDDRNAAVRTERMWNAMIKLLDSFDQRLRVLEGQEAGGQEQVAGSDHGNP